MFEHEAMTSVHCQHWFSPVKAPFSTLEKVRTDTFSALGAVESAKHCATFNFLDYVRDNGVSKLQTWTLVCEKRELWLPLGSPIIDG